MSKVRRIYVEKKESYAVNAKELEQELKNYLGIKTLKSVRVLNRYMIENVSEETYRSALNTVFLEPPIDILYEDELETNPNDRVFSVEYLPGQFDQRADSSEQCVKLLNEKEEPVIRSATTYILSGDITDEEFEKIKAYCINPVDSRETDEAIPMTLVTKFEEPDEVKILTGFTAMDRDELRNT